MAITATDIKLMQSERLTDNADGGGRMSGNEVVDGVSNNLFPDISSLDRVYGRVSLRKAFAAVLTNDTDMLLGGHAIIQSLPADANVSVLIFQTGSHTDERAAAAEWAEESAGGANYETVGSIVISPPSGTYSIAEGTTTIRVYILDPATFNLAATYRISTTHFVPSGLSGTYQPVEFNVSFTAAVLVSGDHYDLTLA